MSKSNIVKLVIITLILMCILLMYKLISLNLDQKNYTTQPNTYLEAEDDLDTDTNSQPVRENIQHSGKNFVEFKRNENFIELRYMNSAIGDTSVFSASDMPEPSLYPNVELSEIYANYKKLDGRNELVSEICLAMYGKVKYNNARIYFIEDSKIAYIEGYKWNSSSKNLYEWKYENGELEETDF